MRCSAIYYVGNKSYKRCCSTAIPGKMVCSRHFKDYAYHIDKEENCTLSKKNFTIGGFHSSQAERWSEMNHNKLSGILYYMFLGNKEKRMKAVRDYLEMRKGFMEDEWNEYINKVDNHLVSLNKKPLTQFLSESYSEMFNMNSKYNPVGWVFNLPSHSEFNGIVKPEERVEVVQYEKIPTIGGCKQMSLLLK